MPILVHETTVDHRLPLSGAWAEVPTLFAECSECGWEREAEPWESEWELWRMDCPRCFPEEQE